MLLIEPQCLCGDAQPLSGCGGVQELGGRAHESPRCLLTAVLIGAVPGAGSSGCSPHSAVSPPSGERADLDVQRTGCPPIRTSIILEIQLTTCRSPDNFAP